MPIRSRMSSILGQIEPEHSELFVLEFGKMAESDFVYTLTSTNINRSAPNLAKMYETIRSRMSRIMDLIGPELSELFALQFAKIAESDFVYTLASVNIDQSVPNFVTIYMSSPWGPGFFLLYRIGPLPLSMVCRKRRLKSETNGCFPRNS